MCMNISDTTLQEALMSRRPDFVSSLRQRQKRVQLATENRKLQALVHAEQERLFAEQRRTNANPDAHPYSGGCGEGCVGVFWCVCVCVCVCTHACVYAYVYVCASVCA